MVISIKVPIVQIQQNTPKAAPVCYEIKTPNSHISLNEWERNGATWDCNEASNLLDLRVFAKHEAKNTGLLHFVWYIARTWTDGKSV